MQPTRATLILRVPSSLHQRLKQEAHAADLSLNKHCSNLLSRRTSDSSVKGDPISLTLAAGHSRQTALLRDLSAQVLDTLKGNIEGLVLFGSFARGRQTANSDIDLLVVLNRSMTLDRDVYSHWQLRKYNGREVAPIFVQIPSEGERIGGLWFEVALDGIVLYDNDLHRTSALTGAGLVELKERMAGRVSLLTGHSGVGKSSLLNAVERGLALRIGEVTHTAAGQGKGRHTTSAARLIPLSLPDTFVVDTPGIRAFGIRGMEAGELARHFADIAALAPGCAFVDCLHRGEPACAVAGRARHDGLLRERLDSYRGMLRELE